MTKGKKFKKLVRERMAETGESYSAARMKLDTRKAEPRMDACPNGCPITDADTKTPGGRDVCGTCGESV